MPWHGEAADGKVYKYQYHPHGDKNQPLRAAPSAMNTVIVPDVTLPQVCRSNSLRRPSCPRYSVCIYAMWKNDLDSAELAQAFAPRIC